MTGVDRSKGEGPGRRGRPGRAGGWVLVAGMALLAADAGSQQITAHVIASGGGVSRSAGGCRVLEASLGEAVGGRSSGGGYTVTAGFLAATGGVRRDAIFNNGFQGCL